MERVMSWIASTGLNGAEVHSVDVNFLELPPGHMSTVTPATRQVSTIVACVVD